MLGGLIQWGQHRPTWHLSTLTQWHKTQTTGFDPSHFPWQKVDLQHQVALGTTSPSRQHQHGLSDSPETPESEADKNRTAKALKAKWSLEPQPTKVGQDLDITLKRGDFLLKWRI